jgi:thioesterase domain-containing protein/acyl carrier protein
VSSLELPALIREAGESAASEAATGGAKFARPELESEYVGPRDDVERTLVGFWEELLGVENVGVADSFFDLGGHSLIAVRVFARIRKAFRVDFPISLLFEAPTVAAVAARIREAGGGASGDNASAPLEARARYRHLVPMHAGEPGPNPPFFLVAGMFGNVLNLRHLAQLIGRDRAVYGLQARGLFGDMEPHATFEEAARDYIAEMRQVQAAGPYAVGGFSGGGITAFEIVRQLLDAGEEVASLVLLDTPLPQRPELSRADRLAVKAQDLRREGPAFFGRWAKDRLRWEIGKVRRRFAPPTDVDTPVAFHSLTVEKAFREALGRYRVERLPVRAWLFRPAQDRYYDLGAGRYAGRSREIVLPDNGWTPFVERLDVVEVPGDHDSMVLEPNVRSLATGMGRVLGG